MSERMDHIFESYIEAWNTGNMELLDDITAADVQRRAGTLDSIDGLDALKGRMMEFRTAFPDLRLTIRERAYGADFFTCIWNFVGTNTGPGEFPALGKRVDVTGSTLIRVRDGRMAEEDVYFDTVDFMTQLGA